MRAGTSRNALDHPDFRSALGRAANLYVVHEGADQEYTAAARLEQIVRRQWIGHRVRIESFALIPNAYGQNVPDVLGVLSRGIRGGKLDEDAFARIVAVSVCDGIDHALANRDPDIVLRVIVQTESPSHVVADDLHKIEHFERARELEPHNH